MKKYAIYLNDCFEGCSATYYQAIVKAVWLEIARGSVKVIDTTDGTIVYKTVG